MYFHGWMSGWMDGLMEDGLKDGGWMDVSTIGVLSVKMDRKIDRHRKCSPLS